MTENGSDSSAMNVLLDPIESLTFHLQPQTSPQAVLTIKNISEVRKIAFKVKTTRPLRYLVRPNQGMLGPNATASIMVILQQKDCDELLRLDPSERQLSNDKFLVQSIHVDDSFYELVKTKSAKEMADELTNMWSHTDKKSLSNKKLRCRFIQEEEIEEPYIATGRSSSMNEDGFTSVRERVSDVDVSTPEQLSSALLEETTSVPVVSPPGSGSNKEPSFQEVAGLRKKYDELVAFTVQLTAQRDALMNDLDKTRQLLQKSSTEARKKEEGSTLRQRKTGTSSTSHDDVHTNSQDKIKQQTGTFGLFHLLVCAIIFFLIGRYY